jgi:hypothetical protein
MNATTTMNGSSNTDPKLAPSNNIIAINTDEHIQKSACGLITMWSCSGEVTVDALASALKAAESSALPPEPPSALVALNRAVKNVAKELGHLDVHHKGRGEWAIVGDGVEVEIAGEIGKKALSYPINCIAKVEKGQDGAEDVLTIEGQGADKIRAAYAYAKGQLAPADIGNWLCEKVAKLGGVALRDRGGVYFVPRGTPTVKWNKIAAALKKCSRHNVHVIYSMKSADAIEAILSALTADTLEQCKKVDEGIATLGDKGLKNREVETAELFGRIDLYEGLLGQKLDDLRSAVERTRAAIATARLALAAGDGTE